MINLRITKSYAQAAQANLVKQISADFLAALPVLNTAPTPEERYIAARKQMERFSYLQTLDCLSGCQTQPPISPFDPYSSGFGLPKPVNRNNNTTQINNTPYYWQKIDERAGRNLQSFPLHLNLHLLNIVYYNSLSAEFFRDSITLDSKSAINPDNGNRYTDYALIKHDVDNILLKSKVALGVLIRSLALEPNAFPLIIKLPSGEFLFLFVRNYNNNPDAIPKIHDLNVNLNVYLTPAQQAGISKKNPISSYINSLNVCGLKVLSYLCIKTCKKKGRNFYYVPIEMYSLDNLDLPDNEEGQKDYKQIGFLKHAYVISMFTIALKMLGSITLPRMNRSEPHTFDSQLTESVRKVFKNSNYISCYDRKNTAYLQDHIVNPFTEHTFVSSQFWSIDKTVTVTNEKEELAGTEYDSYPDLLGLGDITSTSPSSNEIPFIEITQWDITEGMSEERKTYVHGLKGSVGLTDYTDYTDYAVDNIAKHLVSDEMSGILISDGSAVNKGLLSASEYYSVKPPFGMPSLFYCLKVVCANQIVSSQNAAYAGGKYFNLKGGILTISDRMKPRR